MPAASSHKGMQHDRRRCNLTELINRWTGVSVQVYRPRLADEKDFVSFHSEDYIHFLRNINPDTMVRYCSSWQTQTHASLIQCQHPWIKDNLGG